MSLRRQCLCPQYFGFIFVQWREVEITYRSLFELKVSLYSLNKKVTTCSFASLHVVQLNRLSICQRENPACAIIHMHRMRRSVWKQLSVLLPHLHVTDPTWQHRALCAECYWKERESDCVRLQVLSTSEKRWWHFYENKERAQSVTRKK